MADRIESRATLPWLVRLRWLAIAGQLAAIVLYHRELDMALPWRAVVPLLGFTALTNLALALWLRRHPAPREPDRLMVAALTLDTATLTVLLATTGGAANPFTIFYIAHIVLAAVVLTTRSTVWITVLSALCFGALFLLPADEHAHHHHDGMMMPDPMLGAHLRGMWIAFAIAATVIAFFVRKISLTIAEQHEQIARLRERDASRARLASLAALAAGAAHELGTPLGTIAVAAREMELECTRHGVDDGALADVRLIIEEVQRCRSILGGMSAHAGEEDLRLRRVPARELLEGVRARFDERHAAAIRIRVPAGEPAIVCPPEATVRTLASLVKNAFDAGADDAVELEALPQSEATCIVVRDRGHGMSEAVLARAGEPFFTTKEPGAGMGLGLFIARSLVESLGGRLELQPREGGGTEVRVTLPHGGAMAGAASSDALRPLLDGDEPALQGSRA